MPTCDDIRTRTASIDAAIALAVCAALYSSVTYSEHGSVANNAFLSAVHWLVVLLLGAAKFKPAHLPPCDVEVTWLLYGVLFGQMELDAAPAFVLIVLSAYAFQMHKRKQRLDQMANDTAALASDTTSDGQDYA